jgi:diadenosine tetraphosphate (Ap4A) HIT family hydrolase
MNEANYPWVVAVPKRPNITEIFQLDISDQHQLMSESVCLGAALMSAFKGDKLNVAALGNLVPQLHVHHIVRNYGDPAWPAPVWGHAPPTPYTKRGLEQTMQIICTALEDSELGFQAC